MSLKKYSNTNKAEVDEPSVWKISNGSIQVERAGGTELISFEDEFTILFGNISAYSPINPDPVEPVIPEPTPTPTPSGDDDNPSGGGSESGNEGGNSGSGSGNEGGGNSSGGETTPSGNGNISFTLVNNCGYEVRLCGEANLNIYDSTTASHGLRVAQLGVHIEGLHSYEWTNNSIIIPPNGTKTWYATIDNKYLNGNYYVLPNDDPYWMGPLFIYSKYYSVSRLSVQHGNGMYFTDTETRKLLPNKNYTFTIVKMNDGAILADSSTTITSVTSSGKRYAVLLKGQTSLPQ